MTEFARHREAAERQRRATEQAATWYLDQHDGLDPGQQEQFLAWLRQSPLHVTEYLAIARLHGDLAAASALDPLSGDQLCELAVRESPVIELHRGQEPRSTPIEPLRRPWRAVLAQAAAAAVVLLLGASAQVGAPLHAWDIYATSPDALRAVSLPDGTEVQLDRGSLVAVSFDNRNRRIDVLQGGALFDAGHDPARPLLVRAGANELRDIGTVFDVHRGDDDGARVTVISGRVQLSQANDTLPLLLADLTAGQQAITHRDGSLDLVDPKADLAGSTAWLPADIRFERASVAEVARRFNAYSSYPLRIEDARIGATRISGRFHSRDMEAFIAYLRTLPNVQVIRGNDDIRVVDATHTATHSARL
ncbi:FecR domain-containing protein [Dyella sp. C9]|uniref:FecR family protein n=1 Tax=Dyella sp. C9 TaxID=2202154 RepID=UPI000DEFC3C4|nr:FecR domain-containing protein [Dyella sp. C9]